MLRIRLLGTPEIEGRQDSAAPNIVTKPKRFALLAYLVVATPRGFHRRDTLLALLWPEFDQQRARAALSRTLYELRQDLDEGTIITRGNDEIGVDRSKVWCDVIAFEEAIAAGDLLAAMDLYRGDFMRGFYVSGSPDFEHWQERESARLREMAISAAAHLSATMGDAPRWARRAREIDPGDERMLQNLLIVLDAAGDRVGALREYDVFARHLAEAYGAEPSNETQRLVEAIRCRVAKIDQKNDEPQETRPATDHTTPEPSPEPNIADPPAEQVAPTPALTVTTPAPAHGEAADLVAPPGIGPFRAIARFIRRCLSGRRRLRVLLTALTLAVLAVGVVLPWPVNRLVLADHTVAVLPFEYRGAPDYAYLAEGTASILAADLTTLPGIETVDPRVILATIGRDIAKPNGPRDAVELARRLDAGLFVLGDIVEAGGRLRLNVSLYESGSIRKPRTTVSVEGSVDDIFALSYEIAITLFRDAPAASTSQFGRSNAATRSLVALEAYVAGERAFRLGRFGEAQDHLQRALRADTTFALAALRLSQAANWTGADWLVHLAADAAVRHGDRLSERQRLFATAWRSYIYGAGAAAERGYRALLATDSLNSDAWFYLGETIFHWGPTYGWPMSDAVEAFDRALELDPSNVAAIVHRGRLAAAMGDIHELNSLTERLRHLAPTSDHTLELRALRAWATGNTEEQERIQIELRTVAHPTLWQIALSVAVNSGAPGATLALVPLLFPSPDISSGDPGGHIQARVFAAILEAARGRFAAANVWLDAVAAIDPARAIEYRGALAIQPYETSNGRNRESLRTAIEKFRAPPSERAMKPLNREVRPALYGILAARAGDTATVQRALEELSEPVGRELGVLPHLHVQRAATLVRAEAARAAGDAESALKVLLDYPVSADSTLPIFDTDYADAHLRWLRAEIYDILGNDEAALRWYGTFPDPAGHDLVYLAPSHLRRARIHERRGEVALAVAHYNRFISLWRNADPELRPLVDEARLALARLGRENAAGPRN